MSSRAKYLLSKLGEELGVYSILRSSRDTKLLCLQRFTRLFAYGASTLILALYLSSLGSSDARIGLFMTLTLLGDVVISFLLTLVADGLGRRRILALGAALMSASGLVFALSGNYWILVAASIFGVISPRCILLSLTDRNKADGEAVGTRSDPSVLSRNPPWLSSHLRRFAAIYLHGTPSSATLVQHLGQSAVVG